MGNAPSCPRATQPGGSGGMRPHSSAPISVLRAALAGPFVYIAHSAERLVVESLRLNPTLTGAAKDLGISRECLRRLRADFPNLDQLANRESVDERGHERGLNQQALAARPLD